MISKLFPMTAWIKDYTTQTLKKDFVAGITLAKKIAAKSRNHLSKKVKSFCSYKQIINLSLKRKS